MPKPFFQMTGLRLPTYIYNPKCEGRRKWLMIIVCCFEWMSDWDIYVAYIIEEFWRCQISSKIDRVLSLLLNNSLPFSKTRHPRAQKEVQTDTWTYMINLKTQPVAEPGQYVIWEHTLAFVTLWLDFFFSCMAKLVGFHSPTLSRSSAPIMWLLTYPPLSHTHTSATFYYVSSCNIEIAIAIQASWKL